MSNRANAVVLPVACASFALHCTSMTAAATATPVTVCPLCRHAAMHETADRVHWKFSCAHCGDFEITDTARVALETLPTRMLLAISRAVQLATIEGRETLVSLQSLPRLMSSHL